MSKNSWLFKPIFYLTMILYFIWGFTTLSYGDQWAFTLYPEDHFFENLGALSLFIASIISFYVFVRAWLTRKETGIHWVKLLVYLGLAGLYFFGGGEEISWGQRIFHIQEPTELAKENVQGELNIHNLAVFEKNPMLNADNLFTVFWISFAVLLPAVAFVWKRFKQFAEQLTPLVRWGIGFLFVINYLMAKVAKLVFVSYYTYKPLSFVQAVQEIKESNYEFLFIFLALFVLWDLNQLIGDSAKVGARIGN